MITITIFVNKSNISITAIDYAVTVSICQVWRNTAVVRAVTVFVNKSNNIFTAVDLSIAVSVGKIRVHTTVNITVTISVRDVRDFAVIMLSTWPQSQSPYTPRFLP